MCCVIFPRSEQSAVHLKKAYFALVRVGSDADFSTERPSRISSDPKKKTTSQQRPEKTKRDLGVGTEIWTVDPERGGGTKNKKTSLKTDFENRL